MNHKTELEKLLDTIQLKDFGVRMKKFIRNPEMLDGEWEETPLNLAGWNLVRSIILVYTFITILNGLLSAFGVLELPQFINVFILSLSLAVQAIIFGFFFWVIALFLTLPKKRGWHKAYFLQVLQTYSIINFFTVCLFWGLFNRKMIMGSIYVEISSSETIFLLSIAALSFVFSVWLLAIPTVNYFRRYYSFFTSVTFVVLIFLSVFYLNGIVNLSGYKALMIKDKEYCSYLVEKRINNGEISENSYYCYMGACIKYIENEVK